MVLQKKIIWSVLSFLTVILIVFVVVTLAKNKGAETPISAQAQKTAIKDTQVIDFDNWRFACRKVNKNSLPQCRIFQRLTNKGGKQFLLTAVVVLTKKDDKIIPLMRLIAPMGVYLPAGLGFRIDEEKQESLVFQACLPAGCIAEALLDEKRLLQIKTGQKMGVAYKAAGQKSFIVNVLLKGFTAALKTLETNRTR